MPTAVVTRKKSGAKEYYSDGKRVSKSEYESAKAKDKAIKERRASRSSSSRSTPTKSEAQKIVESTPLSEFGKAEGTAKVTRGDRVEYYAGGQRVFVADKPSKYYSTVTTKEGDKVYRYSSTTAGGKLNVREVYREPVAVYDKGKISGYETGRAFSITRQPTTQQIATTKPQGVGVYDTTRQQSRVATPYESMAIQAVAQRGGMSSATQARTTKQILKDPSTRYVYFKSTDEGTQPLATISESQQQKRQPSGVIKPFTLKEKVIGKVSAAGQAFKSGFGFQQFDTGTGNIQTESGLTTLGYVAGATTGIAFSSAMFWEGVGTKAASVAYKSPIVWSGIEKTGKVLSTPAGRYAQRSSLILYGGFKAVDVGVAARREGSIGVAREGFKISRVVAGVGGFGIGFKQQTARNIQSTHYLVKGESQAATTLTGGKSFKRGITSRGKIYEFYDGGLRRSFTFKDVAKVTGKTKEVVRVIEPTQTRTTNVIDAYLRGRTGVSYKAKPFADYTTASDIKVIQSSKFKPAGTISVDGKEFQLGKGKTKFQFRESRNVFGDEFNLRLTSQENIYGVGKSNFETVKYGNIVDVGGKVKTFDQRVTSDFNFKERILLKTPSREIIDLTDEAGLATKAATKKLTQNLVSKLAVYQPQQQVSAAFSVPKTKTETTTTIPKVAGVKVDTTSTYSAKTFIPPDMEQEFKQQYNIEQTTKTSVGVNKMFKEDTDLIMSPRSRSRSRLEVDTRRSLTTDPLTEQRGREIPRSDYSIDQGLLPKTKIRQGQTQRQEVALRQSQIYSPVYSGRGYALSLSPLSPQPIFPPSPTLPSLQTGTTKEQRGQRSISFDTKYTPTIEAELFDITGKKPSRASIQSGLTVRPIL